ncbi:MAG: hypothetical protein IKD01_05310 [Oscillospiraceae bacterium]|nr:hypothetical protein [Oscillospiraceae bacterium]
MATAKTATTIKIKAIRDIDATVRIVGDTPLIVHKWSTKAKRMLKAGQAAYCGNDITEKEEYAGPMESFINSLYWMTPKPTEYTEDAFIAALNGGAKFGFRVEAFKNAAIDAAYSKKWIPNKKSVKGLFFIVPDCVDDEGNQLVEIKGDAPEIREDIVVLGGMSRTPDLRWRPQFTNWYVDLHIRFDADGIYSFQDIVNMLNAGGRYSGIGEYRPEKDGQFGMFHIQPTE